ncbi:MAG: hypothetical protein ACXAD7_10485 [Candidatus Kariarchaeaceae archaeon]
MTQPSQLVADVDDPHYMATKRIMKGTFESQVGNDVYIEGTRAASLINPIFWGSDSFDVYSTFGTSRWKDENVGTNEQPTLSYTGFSQNDVLNQKALLQANNQTNDPLVLNYQGEYYDLADENMTALHLNAFDKVGDIIFTAGSFYGFKFRAEMGVPIALSIMLETGDTLSIMILSPTNVLSSTSPYFSTKRTEIVPIVPQEDGMHTMIIKPSGNTVLRSLQMFSEIPITDASEIETGILKSVETTVKFFRYPKNLDNSLTLNGIENFTVNQLGAEVYREYGSSGSITFFNEHGTGIFGITGATTIVTDSEILVAVVAEVPYISEPGQKTVDHFDLPTGVKLEYYFWLEEYEIPMLPLGEDFNIIPEEYSGLYNYYYYSPNSNSLSLDQTNSPIISFNSTSSDSAWFMDPMGLNSRTLYPSTHDVLNRADAQLVSMQQDFIVRLRRFTQSRFTEFPVQSSTFSWTVDSTLNSVDILYLPTSQFDYDMFNITLLDAHNASIDIQCDYYNNNGHRQTFDTATLWHIGNNVNPNYDVVNSTVEYPENMYNLNGMYLRISQTSNTLYNWSISDPDEIEFDNQDLVSRLFIRRESRISYLQDENSADVYKRTPLFASPGQPYVRELNNANDTVMYWIDGRVAPGGYVYSFTAENRAIANIDLYVGIYDNFGGIDTLSSGINDTVMFECAFAQSTHVGITVELDSSIGKNGTLTISVEKATPQKFPTLDLGEILLKKLPKIQSKAGGDDAPFPFIISLIAIPLMVLVYRRRLIKK